jgi:putative ABC transport system permease protein
MTFKSVIIKNFKGSFKQYYSYFLSSSFSIMLFFMYATLILNKQLKGREDTDVLSYVFPITMVSIALFSIFFINYAHSAFMKGRNKEFGVYLSLGINSKELLKMINLESIFINAASLLTGIGVGTLFSRLFHMVILSLLEIKDIKFSLDYRPFLITAVVFVFIFSTVMVRSFLRMRKIDISGLIREARKSEGRDYNKKDPILGSIGLLIMALSVAFLVVIANNEKLISNSFVLMAYMLTAFVGVYLVISYGGNLIIHLLKRGRNFYKNMLSITELHHKFNQNRKIIFVLSVLSTMTIFLVASPFSLLSLSEEIAEMDKNHLEYVETDTINQLPEGTLDKILENKNVVSNTTIKFIFLHTNPTSNALSDCKPVMSSQEYNTLTGSNIVLSQGEAINIVIDWIPGNHGFEPGSEHELTDGTNSFSLRFLDSRKGDWIAGMKSFPSDSVIIVNDADYESISSEATDKNIGYYHLINFKDWKKSEKTITALKTALGENELKVNSIIDDYKDLKSAYSVFLFVSTVMGILFFVAGGSVLYFKQFTELSEAKTTFRKLYKIGISDKEMKSIVGKELLVVFFVPLIFGAFLGVSLIYLMTFIAGGDSIIKEFMSNAFVVIAIYFVSQGAFYLITRNKYITEIVKN